MFEWHVENRGSGSLSIVSSHEKLRFTGDTAHTWSIDTLLPFTSLLIATEGTPQNVGPYWPHHFNLRVYRDTSLIFREDAMIAGTDWEGIDIRKSFFQAHWMAMWLRFTDSGVLKP
jgi:hypothetical protein